MAQRTIVQLTDDLDGTTIQAGKGETIRFSVDRQDYEIDLSDKNAKSFRNDIKKYLDAARRASGGSRRGSRTGGGRGPACDYDPKAVREWAAAQGIEVSSRGRVPADLMTRFQEASPR